MKRAAEHNIRMNCPTFLRIVVVAALAVGAVARAEQKTLYEKPSPFSTIVVTEDEDGLRTLWFGKGGTRQSVVKVGDPDQLELPYARTMLASLAFGAQPKRVLIVGLGGGTIPSFLHQHYPEMEIDVVDIDPDVIAVARRFFGFREDRTMRAHLADGRRFIEECQRPYDMIFLDAFGSDNVPYHLATQEFLLAVRRALAPGGIAVGNVWSRESNTLYDSMVSTYQAVFAELYVLTVSGSGNRILVALPRKAELSRDQLAQRASQISNDGRFRFDLGQAITYGYQHVPATNSAGEVLRDKTKSQR